MGDVETLFPSYGIIVLPPDHVKRQRPMSDFAFTAMVLRFNATCAINEATVTRTMTTPSSDNRPTLVMRGTARLWHVVATATSDAATPPPEDVISAHYEQGLCCAYDATTAAPCTLTARNAIGHGYVLCDDHARRCHVIATPVTPPSSEFLLRRVVKTWSAQE
jgi:hypothetical protein